VLLTTFSYLPNADGVAAASDSTVKALVDAGHDVTVATGNADGLAECSDVAHVVRFSVSGCRGGRDRIAGSGVTAYRAFLARDEWDVILCACWGVWSTALAEEMLPTLRARKVLISHGAPGERWIPTWRPAWGLGPVVKTLAGIPRMVRSMRLYDRMVFLENRGQWSRYFDRMIGSRLAGERCLMIPNAVDPKEFHRSRDRVDESGCGLRVVIVANFSANKNQCLAVEVFGKARTGKATLSLIGSQDNAYAADIRAAWHGLPSVCRADKELRLLIGLPRRAVCDAVAEADICLLTARSETQPIFLLEGMAAGVPFVSTRVGCVTQWPGGLTAHASSDRLTGALERLVADRGLRERLGSEGRRYVERHHDPNVVSRAWHNLVVELMAQPTHGRRSSN
jgi:glycosyltransferase involved in cell wall biosynthesis